MLATEISFYQLKKKRECVMSEHNLMHASIIVALKQ